MRAASGWRLHGGSRSPGMFSFSGFAGYARWGCGCNQLELLGIASV